MSINDTINQVSDYIIPDNLIKINYTDVEIEKIDSLFLQSWKNTRRLKQALDDFDSSIIGDRNSTSGFRCRIKYDITDYQSALVEPENFKPLSLEQLDQQKIYEILFLSYKHSSTTDHFSKQHDKMLNDIKNFKNVFFAEMLTIERSLKESFDPILICHLSSYKKRLISSSDINDITTSDINDITNIYDLHRTRKNIYERVYSIARRSCCIERHYCIVDNFFDDELPSYGINNVQKMLILFALIDNANPNILLNILSAEPNIIVPMLKHSFDSSYFISNNMTTAFILGIRCRIASYFRDRYIIRAMHNLNKVKKTEEHNRFFPIPFIIYKNILYNHPDFLRFKIILIIIQTLVREIPKVIEHNINLDTLNIINIEMADFYTREYFARRLISRQSNLRRLQSHLDFLLHLIFKHFPNAADYQLY